jgi:hypothetical protein
MKDVLVFVKNMNILVQHFVICPIVWILNPNKNVCLQWWNFQTYKNMCTQKGMMFFYGILQVVVIQYYINTIKLVQINKRIEIVAENLLKNV